MAILMLEVAESAPEWLATMATDDDDDDRRRKIEKILTWTTSQLIC